MCFCNKIQKWSSEDRKYSGHKTEGQTIQWPQDRRTDNTVATRQKDRQCSGNKKKEKCTSNDLQNTTQKTQIEQYELH